MKQPLGVILAGGRATRMGGGDKGLLPLGGQTILSHVIDRLEPQVASLALNANGDPRRFDHLGLPVIADSIDGFAGPLSGVLAGLDWAATRNATHIVTAAADTPFLPCDLVPQLMLAAEETQKGLALAHSPGGRQPTFGLWPVTLRDDLRKALTDGLRKVVLWTDRHGSAAAHFPDNAAFFNVNTPGRPDNRRGDVMRLYGIVGYKNAGKTGLMERLVAEITSRSFTVSTVKHAHHSFDVDHPGKDSFRHRDAGAQQVMLSSRNRWALMTEMRDADELPLEALLARLNPVDLVLVEGYKRDTHPKVEAFRAETGNPLIAHDDTTIRAVASDNPFGHRPTHF